ncbi:fibronectin type III domain protein [Trichuris suis]|nr:fibronectin type III domain protein [Trichuris suis]
MTSVVNRSEYESNLYAGVNGTVSGQLAPAENDATVSGDECASIADAAVSSDSSGAPWVPLTSVEYSSLGGGKNTWPSAATVYTPAPGPTPAGAEQGVPCYLPVVPPWTQVICYAAQPPCFYFPNLLANPVQTIANGGAASNGQLPSPLLEQSAYCERLTMRDAYLTAQSQAPVSTCNPPSSSSAVESASSVNMATAANVAEGQATQQHVYSFDGEENQLYNQRQPVVTESKSLTTTVGNIVNDTTNTTVVGEMSVVGEQTMLDDERIIVGQSEKDSKVALPLTSATAAPAATANGSRPSDTTIGPATVRMVSEQNPPMPLSMNVPPGHIVQQIVDENGALRHVILSPQAPPAPPPPPMAQTGPYPSSGRAPPAAVLSNGPTLQYIPVQGTPCGQAIHHPPLTALRFDANGQPNPAAAFYSPGGDVYPVCHNAPYRFCPSDRSVGKYRMSRYDRRRPHQDAFYGRVVTKLTLGQQAVKKFLGAPRMIDDSLMPVQEGAESTATTTTATTVEGSCMEREEMTKLVEMLSRIQPPEVCEVGIREALAKWQPLDCSEAAANGGPFPQIDASEFTYELMLWERRVDAKVAGKYNDYSELCIASTSGAAPCQPEPPWLIEAKADQLTLGWQRSDADEYQLFMEDMDSGYGFLPACTTQECSYTVYNLQRCKQYRFRLVASNEDGQAPPSDVITFCTLPTAPSCPGTPAVHGRLHSTQAKIVWNPPDDFGGCDDVDEYTLQVREKSSSDGWMSVYAGAQREFQLTNLSPGTAYQCRVRCKGAGGESPFSEIGLFTTMAVHPGPVKVPTIAGKVKATGVHVKWNQPETTGGAEIKDYEVELCWLADEDEPDGAARLTAENFEPRIVYQGPKMECNIQLLLPGRSYRLRVRANNIAGPGAWSEPLNFRTAPSAPDCPLDLRCIASTANSLHIAWNPPLIVNGASIVEYRLSRAVAGSSRQQHHRKVSYSSSCSASSLSSATTPSSPSPSVADGETESSSFRVQACNECGIGPYAAPIRAVTLSPPPVAPLLELASAGHNFLKLKWSDRRRSTADDGGRTYFVEMENRLGGHSPVYEGPAKSCKVPRLTENTVYTFRVRASSKNGAPIRIVDVAETTAAVEWSAVKMSLGEGDKLAYAVELRHALAHGGRFLEDVKLYICLPNILQLVMSLCDCTVIAPTTLDGLFS